ncbi:unnamed protein product [Ranitomeya imitator]|uniref:Reverse transcriptase domain-containing protein n=1 Tax=Ranitomeya imitator TaxID=111125 RepID=A0ABN9KXT3_9NEOB|nr:unnamed protein product [Ranitomeya imitator]
MVEPKAVPSGERATGAPSNRGSLTNAAAVQGSWLTAELGSGEIVIPSSPAVAAATARSWINASPAPSQDVIRPSHQPHSPAGAGSSAGIPAAQDLRLHGSGIGCKPVANLPSALEFPHIVEEKIKSELELGRFIYNDVIAYDCSVQYTSFDVALELLRKFGHNALMAKSDIKSAFRILPVNPDGFNSLGFSFQNRFFFDRYNKNLKKLAQSVKKRARSCSESNNVHRKLCLPMGFALSSFYFESFSTFPQWVVEFEFLGGGVLHYLDDFLFIGPVDSGICHSLLVKFLDKLSKLQSAISRCLMLEKITLKELHSLLGCLNFALRIIPIGRVFSRRLYEATIGYSSPHSHIRLGKELKDYLKVWLKFLSSFNGRTMWQTSFVAAEDLRLCFYSDKDFGFGVSLSSFWASEPWPSFWHQDKDVKLFDSHVYYPYGSSDTLMSFGLRKGRGMRWKNLIDDMRRLK